MVDYKFFQDVMQIQGPLALRQKRQSTLLQLSMKTDMAISAQ
jgi:hypothetical protein